MCIKVYMNWYCLKNIQMTNVASYRCEECDSPHLSQLNIINMTALFHSILLNAPQLLHFIFLYSALCRRLMFHHTHLTNFMTCFDKIICKMYLFNPNLSVNRSGLTCLFLNSDINLILLDPPFDTLIIFHIICF